MKKEVKEEKEVKLISLTKVADALIEKGGSFEEMIRILQKEAALRNIKTKVDKKYILGIIAWRKKYQNWSYEGIRIEEDGILWKK